MQASGFQILFEPLTAVPPSVGDRYDDGSGQYYDDGEGNYYTWEE